MSDAILQSSTGRSIGDGGLNVFISYSRSDIAFVRCLQDALSQYGISVSADLQDVEKGADWWERIKGLITQADTIIFALSPDAIDSGVCQDEVEYADSLNKRFVPIVVRALEGRRAPQALSRLNYVYFVEDSRNATTGDFNTATEELVKALETDIDWIREHTRLGSLALRWGTRNRPSELLLRGSELTAAERFLFSQPKHAPNPTDLQRKFIMSSRSGANRRRRNWIAGLVSSAVIVAGLTIIAFLSSKEATQQRTVALAESERKKIERANYVAQVSREQEEKGDYGTALALALEALPREKNDTDTPVTLAARSALREAVGKIREIAVLKGHPDEVVSVDFAPDGAKLLTASWGNAKSGGSDFGIRIWKVPSGILLKTLIGHKSNVISARFSPDGRFVLSASADRTARIWDPVIGKQLLALEGHKSRVTSAVYSVDGNLIATTSNDATVRLWDAKTGKVLQVMTGHDGPVNSAAFSNDGSQLITGGEDATVRIWDTMTGELLHTLLGHKGKVKNVMFENGVNEYAVSGDADANVILWDIRMAKELNRFKIEDQFTRGFVTGLGFVAQGNLLVATGAINSAPVLRLRDQNKEYAVLRGHSGMIRAVAVSPDMDFIATASFDQTARVWDFSGNIKALLRGHTDKLWSIAYSPNGELIATGSLDGTARIWRTATSRPLRTLPGAITTLIGEPAALSDDGRFLAVAWGEEIGHATIWDLELQSSTTLPAHSSMIISVAITAEGGRIATSSMDGTVKIWRRETGKLIATIDTPRLSDGNQVFASKVSFSPDGKRLAVTFAHEGVRILNAESGTEILKIIDPRRTFDWVDFSPHGEQIVTADSFYPGTGARAMWGATIWDSASGTEVRRFEGHESKVLSAKFSPAGGLVLTTSQDKTARLWDMKTGEQTKVFRGHDKILTSASFSRDGRLVITAAQEPDALIWDIASGELYARQAGVGPDVGWAVFSNDDKEVWTMGPGDGMSGGKIGEWPSYSNVFDLVAEGCKILPRTLTDIQRQAFGLSADNIQPICGRSTE